MVTGATKGEKGEDEDQEFNNLFSLSLSLSLSSPKCCWTCGPCLALFGRCRETSAMKRDIFPRQKCHRARSSSGDLSLFSQKNGHFPIPTRVTLESRRARVSRETIY